MADHKQAKHPFADPKRKRKTIQHDAPSIAQMLRKSTEVVMRPEGYLDHDIHDISRYHRRDLDLTDLEALNKKVKSIQEKIKERKQSIIDETNQAVEAAKAKEAAAKEVKNIAE